jgi:lipopolysaccharide/colanic/teichoic acid biosynthesis glycosyltransferase
LGDVSIVDTRPPTDDDAVPCDGHHYRWLSMKPSLKGLWQLDGNGAVENFGDVVKPDCEFDIWSLSWISRSWRET